jgi:hypothetical protein
MIGILFVYRALLILGHAVDAIPGHVTPCFVLLFHAQPNSIPYGP